MVTVKDGSRTDEDRQLDLTLRPTRIEEYVGQRQIKENLRVYMKAARHRREALDHVLLTGPPGLGKTTPATLPPCSRIFRKATSFSSTRSIVCYLRWKRSSIRRWKTINSIC